MIHNRRIKITAQIAVNCSAGAERRKEEDNIIARLPDGVNVEHQRGDGFVGHEAGRPQNCRVITADGRYIAFTSSARARWQKETADC